MIPISTAIPSTLRRASTHTSTATTNSKISASIQARRSTDSRVLDDVLNDGDEIGPGLAILGQPINIVGTRTLHVPPMRVIRKLGAGSYAVVYLVQEIVSYSDDSFLDIHEDSPPATPAPVGRKFAVKCLAKHAQDQDAQLLEATIHQSLPIHDNVVTLWHTLETASYLLLVLDYVPGEDLFYFLEQSRDYEPDETVPGTTTEPLASLPPEQLLSTQRLRLIASMFSQMCDAVAHCHCNHVFHRDIKPENFMVTDARTFNPATGKHERKVSIKLTDFGLATRDIESGDMDCGSGPYMSFETNNNFSPTYATAPADVWSLGVILINMLYHANPWLTTAVGQCESFSHFLREPMRFFMHRFSGMTPAVAEFFVRSVFCLLDNGAHSTQYGTNIGRRITAESFGQWARDIHHHLGPSARRTPALAFQQLPNPPSVSSSRLLDEFSSKLVALSVSQPDTRTLSPSYRTRPSVPVHANPANYGTVDVNSDSDSDDGEPMLTSSSKRLKRALRGKVYPPSTQTDAALYAASILAAKSDEVGRQASLMKTTTKSVSPAEPAFMALLPESTMGIVALHLTTEPSSHVNTLMKKRSAPELRRNRSNKWTEIFKRDPGSDQELTSVADRAKQDREDGRTSSFSQADLAAAAAPAVSSATIKNIDSLLQALEDRPEPRPLGAPYGVTSSSGIKYSGADSRGHRNEKRRGNNQRAASPGTLISVSTWNTATSDVIGITRGRSTSSNNRRARSTSPTQAALEHFNLFTPPIPAVPGTYHSSIPHSTQGSVQSSRPPYAPSIASVSTTTTSSSGFTAFSGKKTWRSSNTSVRSVSTAATSVSSGSWRATSIHGQPVPALPSNIKRMDGLPELLEALPNHHRHRGPNSERKRRAPSASSSPAPGFSFALDTIPEKPKKSAMKQLRPSTGKSTAKNEVGGDPVSSFDLSGVSLSFGAAHGGKLLDLPPIKMDEANGNSLGDASGEQAQRLIQLPGAETVGEANADGSIIAATDTIRPPNSSRKNSWWRRI
ncbi:hypothetical protein M408DRAFT_63937 [Serendipita vermifera MAFF 305830]|uniref:Protein kinase domain-containing protein n=1 Tax=Serendipita vermifera MAFF 305830 TaxID=933852 RepID=A0A0C3B506_SERVB|nr:hypothetical protein M408DRAFT_63937 [Serendipita vermifera MAFF 305830]